MTARVLTTRPVSANKNPYTEFDGYYTLEVDPIKCVACGMVMKYVEVDEYHLIVVWEEMDDSTLLTTAMELKKQGLNPKVVEYEAAFGPCIDYYVARERGMVE